MEKVYLLSTGHLEKNLWFRNDEDFVAGMNHVAIQAVQNPKVRVLSFVLMSNHVHFVLIGAYEDVYDFVSCFKHRYSVYLSYRNGSRKPLYRNNVDVRLVSNEDKGIERAIAYVQMNPVAANICLHPGAYSWGSGNCFFLSQKPAGQRLGDLSERQRNHLMHSRKNFVPKDWMVGTEGFILPQSYVAVKDVEFRFKSAKRMNYFLNSSSKARKRLEAGANLPAFRDQIILAAIPDLCRSLYQKENFARLSFEEQSELARQIRFRFSADANQLARVCGISYADVALLLNEP